MSFWRIARLTVKFPFPETVVTDALIGALPRNYPLKAGVRADRKDFHE
jgi:hypothetical protein